MIAALSQVYEQPLYLSEKLESLKRSPEGEAYSNRVLLLVMDRNDEYDQMTEVTLLCVKHSMKVLVCQSYFEAMQYLRNFRTILVGSSLPNKAEIQ